MEFRRSKFVEQRVKVHSLDEGYVWVPKGRDFTKDPKEKIPTRATMFQEVENLLLFHPKGCLVVFFVLRGCLAVFSILRGCLGWI